MAGIKERRFTPLHGLWMFEKEKENCIIIVCTFNGVCVCERSEYSYSQEWMLV